MIEIFKRRPFKTRNADEYNLNDILSLFVNPIDGLRTPLDFENSIIKGRMGSGKTMFLRANYAYYLFNIIPRLIEQEELILPVFIKLSDFQHIHDSSEIYRQLVIKIVEELSDIFMKLQNQKEMVNIHLGMKKIPKDLAFDRKIKKTAEQLLKLGSEEYLEKITDEFGLNGKVSHSFFTASANYKKNKVVEVKQKKNPGIKDIIDIYDLLLKDSNGKILILIDEAGSLDKQFFKSNENGSFFEIFMNQLRTTDFIRTKIAVYPNSYSDILTETRYGDVVHLEEDILNKESYISFREKINSVIYKYLNYDALNEEEKVEISDIFDISNDSIGDSIEQLINGSGGNFRRLIQLLDLSMNESFILDKGLRPVSLEASLVALKNHSQSIMSLFTNPEKEFINSIATVCKRRGTYRFTYPKNSQILFKYLSKSQEYNILNILEQGSGRKGTIYAFDYSFCVLKELTTHFLLNSQKVDKERSFNKGNWVTRNVTINEELLIQAEKPGKITGIFKFIGDNGGFITDEKNIEYLYNIDKIIQSDKMKKIEVGKEVIFFPWKSGDILVALDIEIT